MCVVFMCNWMWRLLTVNWKKMIRHNTQKINLSHWLGLISLAKGKPQPLDFEDLIDIWHSDRLVIWKKVYHTVCCQHRYSSLEKELRYVIEYSCSVFSPADSLDKHVLFFYQRVSDMTFFEIVTWLSYFVELLEKSSVLVTFKPK